MIQNLKINLALHLRLIKLEITKTLHYVCLNVQAAGLLFMYIVCSTQCNLFECCVD